MRYVDKYKKDLSKSKRLDSLSTKNIEKLRIIKPLNQKQKKFLNLWKTTNDIQEITKKIGCSRPLVYKMMSDLARHEIIEV